MQHEEPNVRNQKEFFMYDPYRVVKPKLENGVPVRTGPIGKIWEMSTQDNLSSFNEIASTRGIIFMYELVNDNTAGIITY